MSDRDNRDKRRCTVVPNYNMDIRLLVVGRDGADDVWTRILPIVAWRVWEREDGDWWEGAEPVSVEGVTPDLVSGVILQDGRIWNWGDGLFGCTTPEFIEGARSIFKRRAEYAKARALEAQHEQG